MKNLILLFVIILLWSCTDSLDFKIQKEMMPVFYVILENGMPVSAFVGETSQADTLNFLKTDTLNTQISLYENGSFAGNLFPQKSFIVDTDFWVEGGFMVDTLFSYNHGLKYTLDNVCEPNNNYTCNLQYKNYPEIELSGVIPEVVPIDSLKIIPNVSIDPLKFYVNHSVTIFFRDPPGKNLHYLIHPHTSYEEYIDEIHGNSNLGHCYRDVILNDNEIQRGSLNSINFIVGSVIAAGACYIDIELLTISDGMYKDLLNVRAWDEYYSNLSAFDPIIPMQIYSMTENSYTNVYAFSSYRVTSELIQVPEVEY